MPGIALATDTGDEVAARVLFSEGRRLAAAGDYPAACPKFEESFRLDPGIGTSFNLADCWQHIGRTASAWARFLDVAASARAAGQIERERLARQRASDLEPQLSRLVVAVSAADDGLSVQRDGSAVRDASWGVAVPVDPGPHLIEASAPGKKKWSSNIEVPAEGQLVSVAIPVLEDQPQTVDRRPAAPPAPPLERDLPPASTAPAPPSPIPSIALGAVSIAGLVTGAIFAFEFRDANAEAKTLCRNDDNTCASADEKVHHDRLVSNARRDRYLAYGAAGVGLAAGVVAAVLWWRPLTAQSATPARVALRPLGASGAAVAVIW